MPDASTEAGACCEDIRKRPLQLAKACGFFRLGFAAQKRKNPLLILCYHGISKSNEHQWNPELYIPKDLFRHRLERIRSAGYQVLPLELALDQAAAGRLKKPTAVITFDDGWHDFYSEAWPILREFGYPATVYQTSFYSKYNRPVFDTTVPYLLWSARGGVLSDFQLTGRPYPIRLASQTIIRETADLLRTRARKLGLNAEDKDGMLQKLAAALSVNYSRLLRERVLHLMNSAEIQQVSNAGVDVQLHTHTHRLPKEKKYFLEEIERNRSYIESVTGRAANHFCYPNGWHRPELSHWLKSAGVKTATTCDPGAVRARAGTFYLPRLTDSCYVSDVRFESWLAGVGLVGSLFKRWLKADSSWPSKSEAARASMQDAWFDEPDPEDTVPVGGKWAARAVGGRG